MRRLLRHIFDKVARDQTTVIKIAFSDGSTYCNRSGSPDITVVFKTRTAEHRTIVLGYVGFFESYFDGKVDIVGEHALRALIRMAYTSNYRYVGNPIILALRKFIELRDNNRDFSKAKENARRHYGLPHEFFRLILGDDCLYAEGYWGDGAETLATAQRARCDLICRKLFLQPGTKLVEVGSGWGHMAIHAAEKYGADVVNYGLVPEQNIVMQKRIDERGLSARVRIVEKDHRDLVDEPETYDRYLSVGVYEHAGRYCQRSWIASIASALKPGGIGLISTTGYLKKSPTEFLTIKHVFPGGSIPSLPRTLELLDEYGLCVVDVEELGIHYGRAVEAWLTNFETLWPEIQTIDPEIFTEHFRRVWTYYLSGAVENFRAGSGSLSLHHITFTKGTGIYPQDRGFIYRGH